MRHLSLTAYGVGYTAMRAYLKQVKSHFKSPADLKVRALWCPLTLPGESTLEQSERAETRQVFYEEFGLTGLVDSDWSRKGQPANSDFTLWLTGPDSRDTCSSRSTRTACPRSCKTSESKVPIWTS